MQLQRVLLLAASCTTIACKLVHIQLESIGSRQGAMYMDASQTIPPPSPGYADVNLLLPTQDSVGEGGCGDMQPPEIMHSGGCGLMPPHVQYKLEVGGCGHIDVPKIEDLILSYPILVPDLPLILNQDVVTVGDNAESKVTSKVEEKKHPHGAYEENGGKHHGNSWGGISLAPTNGQEALDNSVEVKGKKCRVAVNNGEIVILTVTSSGVYHGYVVSWDDIVSAGSNSKWQSIQNALIKNRLVKPNGKIIENAKL